MAEIVAQLEQLAKEPPHIEATRRQALCNALQKALIAIEDPYDTVYRVVGSVCLSLLLASVFKHIH